MNTFKELWRKLSRSKEYREEFVAAQVKRGIPFQIRALLKNKGWTQERLAEGANLTQGVISRAMNPNYGNLTLNTLIRIAAGFDVAFIGHFVPFSDLGRWVVNISEATTIPSFDQENAIAETAGIEFLEQGYSTRRLQDRIEGQSAKSQRPSAFETARYGPDQPTLDASPLLIGREDQRIARGAFAQAGGR